MTDDANDDLGYAPAAGGKPAATTIHTGADGLRTGRVTIDAPDGPFPAYFARPEGVDEPPVVVVISEAFGLHEHIADIARRFAHEGYLAIAPDLMIRQGNPLSFASVDDLVSDLLLHIPDRQVMADLDATAAWAGENGGDVDRLFATGFCWGGRWTWLWAAARAISAAVAWYGIVDGTATFPSDPVLFPHHPIELVDELKTPVLGLYGARDEAIPVATVEAMRTRLTEGDAAAAESSILVYPDAGHAFFADYRDSYVEPDARDGWRRCLAWFDWHGGRAPSSPA